MSSSAKPQPPPQPLLLGRYEIGKLLGHGTFAKVYHARNVRTNEGVAIKVIDKEKILKGGLIAHIKREISNLRRVRHPNIVQLFEVMATKAKIYFVMEYVRGGELFNKVAKGRLKEDVARRYFQQLISAVSFCHARGVFHRDLKPENLLLDEDGNLKVSDFGLSAVSDQIRQDGLFHTFCGTPAYVAPEVLSRKGYDAAKVDIWSCGVILFVLMAGYLPFHDQNIMLMYKKIYKGEFRCPRWFSPELARLLSKLLDTNPDTRITIPEVMQNRWFKKGFKHIKFYVEDDKVYNVDDEAADGNADDDTSSEHSLSESESEFEFKRRSTSLPRPASLNAFDIISFSPGFDLSGLFEEGGEGARFVSGAPVSKIIGKLEEIAKVVSFTVRKKDCRVSLEGSRQGVKGPLTIAAEIFELTPKLVMVEVKKKGGDKGEYEDFCNKELRPGLQKLMQDESEGCGGGIAASNDGNHSLGLGNVGRLHASSSMTSLDSMDLSNKEVRSGLQKQVHESEEVGAGIIANIDDKHSLGLCNAGHLQASSSMTSSDSAEFEYLPAIAHRSPLADDTRSLPADPTDLLGPAHQSPLADDTRSLSADTTDMIAPARQSPLADDARSLPADPTELLAPAHQAPLADDSRSLSSDPSDLLGPAHLPSDTE